MNKPKQSKALYSHEYLTLPDAANLLGMSLPDTEALLKHHVVLPALAATPERYPVYEKKQIDGVAALRKAQGQ